VAHVKELGAVMAQHPHSLPLQLAVIDLVTMGCMGQGSDALERKRVAREAKVHATITAAMGAARIALVKERAQLVDGAVRVGAERPIAEQVLLRGCHAIKAVYTGRHRARAPSPSRQERSCLLGSAGDAASSTESARAVDAAVVRTLVTCAEDHPANPALLEAVCSALATLVYRARGTDADAAERAKLARQMGLRELIEGYVKLHWRSNELCTQAHALLTNLGWLDAN